MTGLENLNARIVHQLSYGDVRTRLEDMGADGGEDFWQAVHSNLSKVQDAAEWYRIVYGDTTGDIADEDRDFISQAATPLPEEPWDNTIWKSWTDTVKQASGRKGKGLFMPLASGAHRTTARTRTGNPAAAHWPGTHDCEIVTGLANVRAVPRDMRKMIALIIH